jgi:urease accessory protein UreE
MNKKTAVMLRKESQNLKLKYAVLKRLWLRLNWKERSKSRANIKKEHGAKLFIQV